MGAFAKAKIDKVIAFIKKGEKTGKAAEYKKTIEQIGEPILRNKLMEMWADEFGVDEEIEFLEQRLAQLRNKKNSNND